MEFVGSPYYQVLYNGKNITADVSKHLLSLSYTDKTEGESDELQISLEDKDRLWQNEWYPEKGAILSAEIGMKNGLKLDCGSFMIDEIELGGPPDVVNIRGLAIGIHGRLKTAKGGRNHEGKTLSEIVHTVASINGFTVQGTIDNIRFGRIAQHRENDLQFLSRLASEYGHTFSIRGKILIFTKMNELEARPASLTFDRSDLISFSIKDKTSGIYKRAIVKFHNPETKEVSEYVEDSDMDTGIDDDLEIKTKAENKQQAEAKAKAALHRANTLMQSGNISVPGDILMVAGNNVELTGMGMLSGVYHILNSTHTVDKSGGYTVDAEIKKVKAIASMLNKSAVKPKAKKTITSQGFLSAVKNVDLHGFDFNTLNKPEGWL
ncbi:MAG: contractile injection system protein, VgrG/Pvc8 family [Chitinophagaceae bacterium]|nr:contractile injection system protein, VgrG/Pvc8 family [Chitinophagaceae bacterium]